MSTFRSLKIIVLSVLAVLVAACGSSSPPSGNSSSGGIDIRVMSNRADLISGGDALLDIVTPAGVDSASVTMSLNGKDVSGAFASTEDGTLRGLVTGLDVGDRSEEHKSELQSLMRTSFAVF